MPKLWNWIRAVPHRRALQALTLTIVAAVSVALPALGGSSATILRAQNGPPPLHAHSGHTILMTGSVPNALRKAKRVGVESGAHQLDLVLSLQLSNLSGLATLLASQQNPKSPQYHKYLTSKDFVSRFAPSTQAVNAVRQFLTSQGLKVTSVSANRTVIHASGTVAQANRAFGVSILQYQLGKRTVYGPDRAPQIPDSLAPYVMNVGGLDNVLVARPLLQQAASAHTSAAHATKATTANRSATGPAGGFVPTELRGAYDVSSLISAGGNGSGQSVGIFELAPYIPSDFSAYESYYGLPGNAINNYSVDGASPTCATAGSSCDVNGVAEADLDLEVASALAPNATLDVWTGPNSFQGLYDTYNYLVAYDIDQVVTTSWGICEPAAGSSFLNALDQVFAQAAVQGQTIAAAAGDYGSDACKQVYGSPSSSPNVLSPAGDPYVLSVGGTSLTLTSGSYGSETVWNQGNRATGGGLSSYFAEPSWQVGAGVANTYSTGEREVPDVAADADPGTGYSVYCTSYADCGGRGWTVYGGTSAAAPLWAGVLADINSYLVSMSGNEYLGWVNPTIYELLSSAQTYAPFHDITTGNNDIDFSGTAYAGDYPATSCYDLTTGAGSPDAWNIARDVQTGVSQNGGGACPASPAATNLVQNGGFENGTTGWNQYSSGGYPLIGTFGQAHSGQAIFYACGYANCDDRAWQTITVPSASNFTAARLTVWIDTQSLFPVFMANPPCVDHLYVTLSTPDGTVVPGGQVIGSCVSNPIFGYQYESFDVTSLLQAHASQQLVLTLRGTTTNEAPYSYYTGWEIDDVALTVS